MGEKGDICVVCDFKAENAKLVNTFWNFSGKFRLSDETYRQVILCAFDKKDSDNTPCASINHGFFDRAQEKGGFYLRNRTSAPRRDKVTR